MAARFRRGLCKTAFGMKIVFGPLRPFKGPFILEWIAHHLAVGFEHFLVFTNDCDDGTVELLDALAAHGIGPGDEVITSPLTFCSTANVVLHLGGTPVFADIGEDYNIDPDEIENLAEKPEYAEMVEGFCEKLRAFQRETRDPWLHKWDYE